MRLRYHVRSIRFQSVYICQGQMGKELDITLRSFDRRKSQTEDFKPDFFCECDKILQNLYVYSGVSNNALLTHLFLTCFKLGFNQA